MTLHDARMYFDYAAKRPTLRAMVAAYLGIKPPSRPQAPEELLAMFPGGALK